MCYGFLKNCYLGVEEAADESSTIESLQYEFSTIRAATNDFSDSNKLGQGGFGAVYKVIQFMNYKIHSYNQIKETDYSIL